MLGKFCSVNLLRTSRVLSTSVVDLRFPSKFNKSPLSSYLVESADKQWRRRKKNYHTTTMRFENNRRNYKGEGAQCRRSGQNNIWMLGVLGTAFMARDLIVRTVHAEQAKRPVLETEHKLITKENFEENLEKLRRNNPEVISIEFTFSLNKAQLQELNSAIESNTKLGYITWHKDQDINEVSSSKNIEKLANRRAIDITQRSYPTDLMHGLLSAHCASETGKEAGKSKVKAGDVVIFSVDNTLNRVFQTTSSLNLTSYLSDWKVYEVIEDAQTGYLGIIYENRKARQIVLAHRSTNFALGLTTRNILKQSGPQADFESVVMGRIVSHQAYGYVATHKAVEFAKTSKCTLSITGHSLGAWLAQLSVYYCDRDLNFKNVKAVTFDGPGTLEMMKQMSASEIRGAGTTFDRNELDIVSYFSAPNIVNCTNKHPGIAYTLPLKIGKASIPKWLTKLVGEKNEDALTSTVGHGIEYVLMHFNSTTGSPELDKHKRVVKWPSITHREYGHAEQVLLQKHTQEMLSNGSLLSKIGAKFGVTITSNIFGPQTTTLGSLFFFLRDFKNGKINSDQFWKVHEYLDREQGYVAATQGKIEDFELLYRGQYKVETVREHERQVVDRIDKYLKNIKRYESEIIKASGNILREGLAFLLKLYEYKRSNDSIAIKEEHRAVTISHLRDKMRILLTECQDELDRCIDSARKSVVELLTNLPVEKVNYIAIKSKEEELERSLADGQVTLISGVGGMGKSTLAQTYGYLNKEKGWQVRWIKGEQIENEFLQIATNSMKLETKGQGPESIRNLVYQELQQIPKQSLFIFDNVENEDAIKKYLINLPPNMKVIITARNQKLLKSKHKLVKIEGFNHTEAINYLKTSLQKTEAEVQELVHEVGTSPFRLNIVTTYLDTHSLTTIEEFIKEYKNIKEGRSHDEEIYPEVEMLFRNLKKETPQGWQLLKYLAYLDVEGVPLDLIKNVMKVGSSLQKYVSSLENLSLLKVIDEKGKKVFKLSHRIIQQEVRKAIMESDKTEPRKIVEALINEIDLLFPNIGEDSDSQPKAIKLIKNAEILIDVAKELGINISAKASLLGKISSYHQYIAMNLDSMLKYRSLETFTGRERELMEIEKTLQQKQIAVVSGIAGIGKSELVAKYVGGLKHQRKELVYWINAHEREEQYQNLAVSLGINTSGLSSEEIEYTVLTRLSSLNKKVLLVIDDVEEDDEVRFFLRTLPSNVKVILTTRNNNLLGKYRHEYGTIMIAQFTVAESIELLKKNLNIRGEKNEKIAELVKVLDSHPLALSMAISYLKQHPTITIDEYIKAIHHNKRE